ncbi:MAG: F0F1 ATP synthase subunit A [Clostridia bacterium]|nr:F0F1 ATP synthase subunit A [Clostridia bacterium]
MDINIQGPKILFTIPVLGGIEISETVVCQWIFMVIIIAVALWLVRDMKRKSISGKQAAAEIIVNMLNKLVLDTMGKTGLKYAPYIGTLFIMSFMGSISGIFGFRPYTANIAVTAAFALVTFVMTQYMSIKSSGLKGWVKSYMEPTPLLLPLNIISNLATPVSIAFRHFGNIFAGTVVTALVYGALASLSAVVLQWIPNAFINSIPFLQVGIPAVLSLYFDWFGAFMQAYIICMLTMVFVADACAVEDAQNVA